jgi:hypothetical protein
MESDCSDPRAAENGAMRRAGHAPKNQIENQKLIKKRSHVYESGRNSGGY